MQTGEDPIWPYLSPSFAGWEWVPEPRGALRRLLLPPAFRAESEPAAAHSADGAAAHPADAAAAAFPTAPGARTALTLDVLGGLDSLLRAVEADALLLIAEAYRRGASWSQIAHRLGRSKQTVHERYQARVSARQTENTLLEDLAYAHHRARRIHELGGSPDDRARATAFLRRHPRPRQSRRR